MTHYLAAPIDPADILALIDQRIHSLRKISAQTGAQQYLVLQVAVQNGYEMNHEPLTDKAPTVRWFRVQDKMYVGKLGLEAAPTNKKQFSKVISEAVIAGRTPGYIGSNARCFVTDVKAACLYWQAHITEAIAQKRTRQ